jgi:hypothetical protein
MPLAINTNTLTQKTGLGTFEIQTISFAWDDVPDFGDIPRNYFQKVIIEVTNIPHHILPMNMINDKNMIKWWAQYPAYIIVFQFIYQGMTRLIQYDNLTMNLDNYPVVIKAMLFAYDMEAPEDFRTYGKKLYERRTNRLILEFEIPKKMSESTSLSEEKE